VNVPNSLTILRILLVPVFVIFLLAGRYEYALATFLLAGITDGLDGTIARVANQQTTLGAYLDPLADKLLLMSAFATLAFLDLVPVWIAILVVVRDLLLVVATLIAKITASRVDISPSLLGKGTTVIQLLYILLVVILASRRVDLHILQPVLYLMVGSTILSGLHYLYRGLTRVTAA
jgi:cardiolipin synthase